MVQSSELTSEPERLGNRQSKIRFFSAPLPAADPRPSRAAA
jgi:hypothetical protein